MPTLSQDAKKERLPRKFEQLVQRMPPRAILDEADHDDAVEMIDRLMAIPRLTKGQELYLETLVQLVQLYEARRHAIDTRDLRGLDCLRAILHEQGMNASALARLLGVHPTMGSKILHGQRQLTVNHLRVLADRFKVSSELFM